MLIRSLIVALAAGLLGTAAPAQVLDLFTRPDTTVRICAGGDVTLGTNIGSGWARNSAAKYGVRVDAFPDPDSLLAPLRPLVSTADVVLLNVEGAIGEGPAPSKCGPNSTRCFAFRQPVGTAAALRRLATDAQVVGNVANNHARDAGMPGLRATVRHLKEAGVFVTGADTLPTLVPLPDGDTLAVLGFSTSAGPDPRDLAAVRRHVGRAAARYPRVVATMHMGAEGVRAQRTPNRTEIFLSSINRGNSVAFARAAAEAGAGWVVGHGPHVMRGMEWHNEALLLYSLGNLLTYGPFSLREPMNRGAVACVAMDRAGRVVEARLHPTRQRPPGLLEQDSARRAIVLADSLSRLDFPRTAARADVDGRILLGVRGSAAPPPDLPGRPKLPGTLQVPAPAPTLAPPGADSASASRRAPRDTRTPVGP